MIDWPDIKFPPVNLYSMPRQWPKHYLVLEANYVGDLTQQFFDTKDDEEKERLRKEILEKREEFNRLWNQRSEG